MAGILGRMRPLAALVLAVLLSMAGVAHAQTIASVEVRGLDEVATANVRRNLSLVDSIGKTLSPRRFDYLLEQAESETRQALEPFGYFSPEIRIDDAPTASAIAIVVTVVPGTPVTVRNADVAISGAAADDPIVDIAVDGFQPAQGQVFDQVQYELAKARIGRLLADRGYLDADLATHRVEVTRAANAAEIGRAHV